MMFRGLFWTIIDIFVNLMIPEVPNMSFLKQIKPRKAKIQTEKTMILSFSGKKL